MFRGKIRVVAGFSAAAALTFAGVLPALAAEGEEPAGTETGVTTAEEAPPATEAAPTEEAAPAAPEAEPTEEAGETAEPVAEEEEPAPVTTVTPVGVKFNQLGYAVYITGGDDECVDYTATPAPDEVGAIRFQPNTGKQTVTVTATPQEGCAFTEGAKTVWTHTVDTNVKPPYDHGNTTEMDGVGFTEGQDEADILEAYRVNCDIFLGIYYATGGTYTVETWDDGQVIHSATAPGPAGEVGVTRIPLHRNVAGRATGVDFGVSRVGGGTNVDYWMNWDFENSAQVMDFCRERVKVVKTKKLADTGTSTSHFPLAALGLITVGGALAVRRMRLAQL